MSPILAPIKFTQAAKNYYIEYERESLNLSMTYMLQ